MRLDRWLLADPLGNRQGQDDEAPCPLHSRPPSVPTDRGQPSSEAGTPLSRTTHFLLRVRSCIKASETGCSRWLAWLAGLKIRYTTAENVRGQGGPLHARLPA